MRKFIPFFLILILTLYGSMPGGSALPVQAQNDFAGGSGTPADPYLVATAAHLNNVRHHLDKHFRQVADIGLGVPPWNEGKGWQPIGNVSHPLNFDQKDTFTGTFDGNLQTISNLTINLEHPDSMGGLGLFGVLGKDALVERVRLRDAAVTNLNYTGALAGINQGMVRGCSASGLIEDAEGFGAQYVGGLVGQNAGLITQSSSAVTVDSYTNFGGLVGANMPGAAITNCFSTGEVKIGYPEVINGAALVGANNGLIQNCYTTGKIGDVHIKEQAITNNFGELIASYYEVNAYGLTEPVDPHGKTTEQMKQQATYEGWDFVNIWQIDEGFSVPYFRPINPASAPVITSPAQTTFTAGQPGSFTISATGSPPPQISSSGALPAGVSFTAGTGAATISGTPADSSGGVYPLTLKAANGISPDATQAFLLTVKTIRTIDPALGGVIRSNQDQISIEIPAAALGSTAEFILIPQAWPAHPTGWLKQIGLNFELTGIYTDSGNPVTVFDEPVTVRISYDPGTLDRIDPETLRLYTWDVTAWEDVITGCPGSEYHRPPGANWFEVGICHLSDFAVLGEGGFDVYLPLIMQ